MKMNRLICLILLFVSFAVSCSPDPPEKREYEPFVCVDQPEERLYFPEEELVFEFNMPVNENSVSGFSVSCGECENTPQVSVSDNKIRVLSPLPEKSFLDIVITSALKSFDNRPLMIGGAFTEKREIIELSYETGGKLPEVKTVVPDDTKSSTVAVEFDSPVSFNFSDIEPKPLDLLKLEELFVFVYDSPAEAFTIRNVRAIERNSILEEIKIALPDIDPHDSHLQLKTEVDDSVFRLRITDPGAIAGALENRIFICDVSCEVVIDSLQPEKNYTFELTLYTKVGIKRESIEVATTAAKPHIIISEVMHSPNGEPQKNFEFVEIFNSGSIDFDLSGCSVDDKNDGKGVDPLAPADSARSMILKPGELAVITGNEADFSELLAGGALWLKVDDTTIADGGLTAAESVQILCGEDGGTVITAEFDPSKIKTEKGFSANQDKSGTLCQSKEEGGTPGIYTECR
ncbi:lamin tail domain-containing protein [bacterium]|nr:lamin tail domain-containing protein [bacterium]